MEDLKANQKEVNRTESFTPSSLAEPRAMAGSEERAYAPLDTQYQFRAPSSDAHANVSNNHLNFLKEQEPKLGDTAPTPAELEPLNYRANSSLGSEILLEGLLDQSTSSFYMGSSRTDSLNSSYMWGEGSSSGVAGPSSYASSVSFAASSAAGSSGVAASRRAETMDTYDFFIKSITSANKYVSLLNREQIAYLRSIRPELLREVLLEVADQRRGDGRMRRAFPNECAFCKNNGESDDRYSSHVLKDGRGRVMCPVLRAFRCPRCGATGDRAHTIKYCREAPDNSSSDRSGLAGRRRGPASFNSLNFLQQQFQGLNLNANTAPSTPAPSPSSPTRSFGGLFFNREEMQELGLRSNTAPPTPAPSPAGSSGPLSYSALWK